MIILRNVPKEKVRIDLTSFEIAGGFRGFQNVPTGAHYISVLSNVAEVGEWLYLQPSEVMVRVFNDEAQRFEDDTPESDAEFSQMAANGAMNKALVAYPVENLAQWTALTKHITVKNFPPNVHSEDASDDSSQSRFEKALLGTHRGNVEAFLAEFEFAFLRWVVNSEDEEAFARWRHLLLALYSAGQSSIEDNPSLFEQSVDVLLAQFELLPPKIFEAESFVTANANYLLEDMQDTELPELVSKSKELGYYLHQRND